MRISFEGLAQIQEQFEKLAKSTTPILKECVYEGAGVVADAIKAETPIGEGDSTGHLRDHLGISKITSEDGYVNASIAFSGYNAKGQSYEMIARSLESGHSTKSGGVVAKHPFMRKAFAASKEKALVAMAAKFDELVKNI